MTTSDERASRADRVVSEARDRVHAACLLANSAPSPANARAAEGAVTDALELARRLYGREGAREYTCAMSADGERAKREVRSYHKSPQHPNGGYSRMALMPARETGPSPELVADLVARTLAGALAWRLANEGAAIDGDARGMLVGWGLAEPEPEPPKVPQSWQLDVMRRRAQMALVYALGVAEGYDMDAEAVRNDQAKADFEALARTMAAYAAGEVRGESVAKS